MGMRDRGGLEEFIFSTGWNLRDRPRRAGYANRPEESNPTQISLGEIGSDPISCLFPFSVFLQFVREW